MRLAYPVVSQNDAMSLLQSAAPALAAALLFGASTPLAKLLAGDVSPLLLAGLLYLGSGTGLALAMLRDIAAETAASTGNRH